jgi:beta-aspartyl-peptidase (threonine type)
LTITAALCDSRAMLRPAIVVHGGAGRRVPELETAAAAGCAAAADRGWAMLASGASALAAVIAAVSALEDDPVFNAGIGACLTADGTVEMDASVMEGTRRSGAGVALLTSVRNPIQLAEAVRADGRHVLLAGVGAETFARRRGLPTAPPSSFITRRQYERWRASQSVESGTVGAAAVDCEGHLAAATSTGGMSGKLPGRIGDSAILGAGTYADDRAGAASATGNGEAIIVAGLARSAVDALRTGEHPEAVARALIHAMREPAISVGIILIDCFGRIGTAYRADHMPTCARSSAA